MAYITKDEKHKRELDNMRLAVNIFAYLLGKKLTNH